MGDQLTTKKLTGVRAIDQARGKRIGKVRRFVFHPSERRLIGFLVKRPDAALMFHRKDLFVALGGCHFEGDDLVVHDDPSATDKGAIRALGVDWDSCVIWVGMPVKTESGQSLGYADNVTFDAEDGAVISLATENGVANDAVLGKCVVPAKMIKGFKRAKTRTQAAEDGMQDPGAIMVSDEAAELSAEGGVAAAAGKASAVAADKAKKGVKKARTVAEERVEQAKPTAQKVAKRTGEAVEAGAFAAGKQLGRASGMFSAFKEEFDKAMKDEDE